MVAWTRTSDERPPQRPDLVDASYGRLCSRCQRVMHSVRPWWSDLDYVCNDCGDRQRLEAAG